MSCLYYLVVLVHIAACLFLIAVVLLQQGKGQDLASAFGGGGTQTAFGPRGSATVLSRATTILAGVFMVTSLGLSLMPRSRSGILDQVPAGAPRPTATASPRPLTPPPATTAPGNSSSTPAESAPKPAPTTAPSGK